MTLRMIRDDNDRATGIFSLGVTQTGAVAAASARTGTDFLAETKIIRVVCSTLAYVAFGDNTVVANNASMMLAPNYPEYFALPAGAVRMAFIRDAADGRISVTEMK